jgi:chromosome partitioning protein
MTKHKVAPMFVLSCVSRKGGTGKSMIASHIAIEAETAGLRVAILDADEQESLLRWRRRRQSETPLVMQSSLATLKTDLGEVSKAGVDLVVIDTPGYLPESITTIVRVSDFVAIVTNPTPAAIEVLAGSLNIVREAKKPFGFIVNAAPRGNIVGAAEAELKKHGMLIQPTVHFRVIYQEAWLSGETARDAEPNGKGAAEMAKLWQDLHKKLKASRTK